MCSLLFLKIVKKLTGKPHVSSSWNQQDGRISFPTVLRSQGVLGELRISYRSKGPYNFLQISYLKTPIDPDPTVWAVWILWSLIRTATVPTQDHACSNTEKLSDCSLGFGVLQEASPTFHFQRNMTAIIYVLRTGNYDRILRAP